ncbi:MAG: L,D-transpeptidase family protein [Candidatus Hydrogenedentota bacterium]
MTQRKFKRKRSQDPNLTRIILVICVVLAAGYGGFRLFGGDRQEEAEAARYSHIEKARDLVAASAFAEARAVLAPMVAQETNSRVTPEALALMAKVEEEEGNPDAAITRLQQLIDQYPTAPERPEAMLELAALLRDAGNEEQATQYYKEVEKNTPPDIRAAALVGLAQEAERRGNVDAARAQYRQAAQDALFGSPSHDAAIDALGKLNVARVFARGQTPDSKVYSVEPGDNLTSIGIKLNTTQGLLMRANGIEDPSRLRVGQRLKWTPKDFQIVIDRTHCKLYLLDSDGIFKRYKVGLGKPGYETTLGKYKIGNKEKHPTWFKPGAGPIPSGDPRNELGTRWMPLVPVEEGLPKDLGIHGTIDPETIGYHSSHGCARLYPAAVEELYDLVVRSTPVEIVEEYQPDEHAIAAQ